MAIFTHVWVSWYETKVIPRVDGLSTRHPGFWGVTVKGLFGTVLWLACGQISD